MSGNMVAFTGDIPSAYDAGLGPIVFAGLAADLAQRVAAGAPVHVLETGAGTGILTRALRDALPPGTPITATDLNADMLSVARTKFRASEAVAFETADATALPFPDGAFDTVASQYAMMFYPDKDKGFRETHRVLTTGGRHVFSVADTKRYNT
jgi:ubiquinone/menaquinone biosynthesis C-methylase UbiE